MINMGSVFSPVKCITQQFSVGQLDAKVKFAIIWMSKYQNLRFWLQQRRLLTLIAIGGSAPTTQCGRESGASVYVHAPMLAFGPTTYPSFICWCHR